MLGRTPVGGLQQTPKIESYAICSWKLLAIATKLSFLDVCGCSNYASDMVKCYYMFGHFLQKFPFISIQG